MSEHQNFKENKIISRAGISPSKADFRLGVLRTHLFNYAIAKKTVDQSKGIFIIRGDNTNQKRHTIENLRALVSILENDINLEIDRHPFSTETSYQEMLQSERVGFNGLID